MKKLFSDNRSDMLIGLIVIICLLLSSNLLSGFMPSSIVMLAIAIFVAAFSLFAVLIWRENPRDEREAHILLASDRLGFLAGAIVLSIGLVIASLRHQSTTLLAVALTAMIIAKLIGKHL
jgi:cobalamin synthase